MLITRRSVSGLILGLASSALSGELAFAQDRYFNVESGAQFKPVPVAVTQFAGDTGTAITAVISNNFSRSVFLTPVDPNTFPEHVTNPDQSPQMEQWKTINAQFVVTGRSAPGPDGRLQTQFRLWDVASGAQVAGQQYVTDPNN